jgi:iron complex transport system substrate-binding protein
MRYSGFAVFVSIVVLLTIGYARFGVLKNKTVPHLTVAEHVRKRIKEIPQPPVFPVQASDATGIPMVFQAAPKRIVSVSPSVTELLFDLGLGAKVVGDTTACDYPTEVRKLPHIGGAFDMSLEKIVALQPDLVVADGTVNKQMILRMQQAGIRVFVIMPDTLDHCWESIRRLGKATGATIEAANLINAIQDTLDDISHVLQKSVGKVKVAVLYDTATLYTSGPNTLIGELITACGGINIAKSNDPLNPEQVALDAPDVILCSPALQENIVKMPGWKGVVPAVNNTAFFHTSEAGTLIRPCRRMAVGALELARYLHPEVYGSNGKPAPFVHSGNRDAGAQ